jgi:hypothetical protein
MAVIMTLERCVHERSVVRQPGIVLNFRTQALTNFDVYPLGPVGSEHTPFEGPIRALFFKERFKEEHSRSSAT